MGRSEYLFSLILPKYVNMKIHDCNHYLFRVTNVIALVICATIKLIVITKIARLLKMFPCNKVNNDPLLRNSYRVASIVYA